MTIARHLSIHGRVQGVFYRAWMEQAARELGLAGWVRNRRDGTVEAVVQGEDRAVERLIECAGDGPPAARVGHVAVSECEPLDLSGFEQRATA